MCCLLSASTPGAFQPERPAHAITTDPLSTAEAAAVLNDAGAGEGARLGAARLLLSRAEEPQAREALERSLVGPLENSAGGLVLRAICGEASLSPRVFPMVAQRFQGASAGDLPRLLAAAGAFRTRDAARLLLIYTDAAQPEPVRRAAFEALSRLAARDDLNSDQAAWARWLGEADAMTESQWRLSLVTALASRNEALVAERREAVARLIATLRSLHLATPSERRSPMLASMLRDPIPDVRNLGFELIDREIGAGGRLDGPVADAAVALLRSPDVTTRTAAANLVRQLTPANAREAVLAACNAETDATAAGAMLLAAARWPTARSSTTALRWLMFRGPAQEGAVTLLLTLYGAGELPPPAQDAALRWLRAQPVDSLSPAACTLLSRVGEEDDVARLRPRLFGEDPAVRQAVAQALMWDESSLGAILSASLRDVDLFEIASRAVLVNDPTAHGLASLLALPQPAPEVARPAIVRVARALPATELWEVSGRTQDPWLRRELLTVLASDEREMSEAADPAALEAIGLGVIALADAQLDAGEADAAAVTLESSPFVAGGSTDHVYAAPAGLAARRTAALVALGRLEPAAAAGGDADAWLRGLRIARLAPFARDVIAGIEDRFGSTLTPAQRAGLDELKASLPPGGPGPQPPRPK